MGGTASHGGDVIGQVGCGKMLARGLILLGRLDKPEISGSPCPTPHPSSRYSDSIGMRQGPEICTLKQTS